MLKIVGAVSVLVCLFMASMAAATDRHAGYYYPVPTSQETYVARAQTMATENRALRLGFVTGMSTLQAKLPYAPSYVIFAKGEKAEKMIIVGIGAQGFRTLYQARAQLAQLTAISRSTKFLRDLAVETFFTFFDVAKLLGFKQITISDGVEFAHQVTLD